MYVRTLVSRSGVIAKSSLRALLRTSLKQQKLAADMTPARKCGLHDPSLVQTTDKGVLQVQLIHSLKSRRDDEEGFTLIELMVVVLIIAILIAIAIPTFLGARQRAQDRAAQSDLRNALTAEKTFYTDGESYASNAAAGSTALKGIEPSLSWGTKLTWLTGDVTVAGVTTTDAIVCLQQTSKSGKTFAVTDVAMGPSAGTYYLTGQCPAAVDNFTGTGWKTNGW